MQQPQVRYTFSKDERLCRQSLIDSLFEKGSKLTCYPYRVCFEVHPLGTLPVPAQALIIAPKRNLHFAVQRNRVKRLTRECYRLRKHELYSLLGQHQCQLTFSLYYLDKQVMEYSKLSEKFDKLMEKLSSQLLGMIDNC